MSADTVVKDAVARMESTLDDARRKFQGIRTGRASVNLLDGIQVESYGSMMPLNQLANISAPEPAMITIQPWDPSVIPAIERAIQSSDLGINPSNDGKLVRLPIPPLTEERRKEIVKRLHGVVEQHRVALRNERRDANDRVKKLVKDKLISEDDERRALEETQKLTDGYISKLETLMKAKEKDILG